MTENNAALDYLDMLDDALQNENLLLASKYTDKIREELTQ